MNLRKSSLIAILLTLIIPAVAFCSVGEGNVAAGEANITAAGKAVNVEVVTPKAVIDWKGLSTASDESLNFKGGETVLNRDISGNPTAFFGSLTSTTAKIFLINTNGVLFGAGSRIDVPALTASTLDIKNEDFLAGKYNFFKNGESAFIINEGEIITNGGYTCLLSQAVENRGTIIANLGTVVMAAGEKITMGLDDTNQISIVIDEAVKNGVFGPDGQKMVSAVKNSGTILAAGGKVILTAKVLNGIFDYAVNNTGIIKATNLVNKNGVIELVAEGAPVINSGTLEAGKITVNAIGTDFINKGTIKADGTAEVINGGKVLINAGTILQQGLISANAFEAGDAGEVDLVSEASTTLDETSSTEARALGIIGNGGRILINSTRGSTFVAKGAVIDVSAGLQAGNGGFIEVSAFDQLGFYGILNGRAPPGYAPATVLFDPANIAIALPGTVIPAGFDRIDPTTLVTFIGTIDFDATNDITVFDPLIVVLASVDFNAGRDINVKANITAGGSVTFTAGRNFNQDNGTKITAFNGDVNIHGQAVTLFNVEASANIHAHATTGNLQVNGDIASTGIAVIYTSTTVTTSTSTYVIIKPSGDSSKHIDNPSGSHYDDVSDSSDSTYVSTDDYSAEYDLYYLQDTTASGTINYVEVYIRVKESSSSSHPKAATVLSLPSKSSKIGSEVDLSGSWQDSFTNYATNPYTASSWTWANINDLQAGVQLKGQDDGDKYARCSEVWVKVGYSVPSTTVTINPTTTTAPVSGNINLEAAGTFTQASTSVITANNGNVSINAASVNVAKIAAYSLVAGVNSQISITATSGAITDVANTIIADDLILSAKTGIGSSANPLDTQVFNLQATNSGTGTIEISNTSSTLNVTQATTNGTNITIASTGDIYVHNISTDGTFTGNAIPASGTVTITTPGKIEDYQDDVINNPYDISALNIVLNGASGIGTTGLAPIELRSTGLILNSNGNVLLYHKGALNFAGYVGGNLTLTNSGDLYITGAIITTGVINLTVIDDPDLYINANLNSGGAPIILTAAEHIVINLGVTIITGGGSFTTTADDDANYSGIFYLMPGAKIDTRGVTNGEVSISASDVELSGTIKAGDANVTIMPSKDQTIALAGGDGDFVLDDSELDKVSTTGIITIGSSIAGDVEVDDLTQPGRIIKIVTAGSVSEQGSDYDTDIIADKLIFDVAGNVGSLTNGIETEILILEGAVIGLININEFDDLALNTLTATNVILKAGLYAGIFPITGYITDNNGASVNIIATTAILDSTHGIDLDTQVAQLSARVRFTTATGIIDIDNTGALALNDLASPVWGYSIKNFGSGDVDISTASPITVNADVIGENNIILTASGADADITINDNVTSNQAGTITLNAARDIIHNSGIVFTAGLVDIDAVGAVNLYNSALIHGNNVEIDAAYLGTHNLSIIEATDTVDINTTGDVEMSGSSQILAGTEAPPAGLVKIASNNLLMHNSSMIGTYGSININTICNVEMYDASGMGAGYVTINAGGEVRVANHDSLVSNSGIHADYDVIINAVNDILLGAIDSGNSINLKTTADSIIDTNADAVNLTTPSLYMEAYGSIGSTSDRIDTDVSDIYTAIALNGNVGINEKDGVNLWNIQALGSTIDIVTAGTTYAYYIYALGTGITDPALINLLVTAGSLYVQDNVGIPSTVYAYQPVDGDASVNFAVLSGDINVTGASTVKAVVGGDGNASVNMMAGISSSSGRIIDMWWDFEWDSDHAGFEMFMHSYHYDDTFTGVGTINVLGNSSVLAQTGSGSATVDMVAANINVHSSLVEAEVIGNGSANVNMLAGSFTKTKYVNENYEYYPFDPLNPYYYYSESIWNKYSGIGSININNNSSIMANIGSGSTATINIVGLNIALSSSIIKANVETYGNAYVNLFAGTSINFISSYDYFQSTGIVNIAGGSQVLATVGNSDGSNTAQVNVLSGGAIVDASTVAADLIGQGSAYVYFLAAVWPFTQGDIIIRNNSFVRASVSSGTADVTLYGDDVNILASTIEALSKDSAATGSSVFLRVYGNGNDYSGTTGNIAIVDSVLNANVAGSGAAEIYIRPLGNGGASQPGDLLIDNSDIIASVAKDGSAVINLVAGQYGWLSEPYLHNNINIRNGSLIKSIVDSGTAVVDINARAIAIEDSTVLASVLANGSASIIMNARAGDIIIQNSTIQAIDGIPTDSALVSLLATNAITLTDSLLQAINTNGQATVNITSTNAGVEINNTDIIADAINGEARVAILANTNISVLSTSVIQASSKFVSPTIGGAYVNLGTTLGNITVDNSQILATGPPGTVNGIASITLSAGSSIQISTNSTINALVSGNGQATINMAAGSDITITNSNITAEVTGIGQSKVLISALGAIYITDSLVNSIDAVLIDSALIDLDAVNNIELLRSTLSANNPNGKATITLDSSAGNILVNYSNILAYSKFSAPIVGGAYITLTTTLGDIIIANSNIWATDPPPAPPINGIAKVTLDSGKDIRISDSSIKAENIATKGDSTVDMDAQGSIIITNSTIEADANNNGTATVDMDALNSISISNAAGTVKAYVNGNGTAKVDLKATNGDISISNDIIRAEVTNDGDATVKLNADFEIELSLATIEAIVGQDGNATVDFDAANDIEIASSTVSAKVNDGDSNSDDALVDFDAGDDIEINASTIEAIVADKGEAEVNFNAKGTGSESGDIVVESNSIIRASVANDGNAKVKFDAENDISVTGSATVIEAVVRDDGDATVEFDADNDILINDALVSASVLNDFSGTAKVEFDAGNNINVSGYADILAAMNYGPASAIIDFDADNNIYIADSTVKAFAYSDGPAQIFFNADNEINLSNATVLAESYRNVGLSSSTVDFSTRYGDIILNNSNVTAKVLNDGYATVKFDAGDEIELNSSVVEAIIGYDGDATVDFDASNDIELYDLSIVRATVNDGDSLYDDALVDFSAGDDIKVNNSTVEAIVVDDGEATVLMDAGDTIRISKPVEETIGTVKAEVSGSGNAVVDMHANNSITIDHDQVIAQVAGHGDALVSLVTGITTYPHYLYNETIIDSYYGETYQWEVKETTTTYRTVFTGGNIYIINDALVSAKTATGDATVDMAAKNISVEDSSITALVTGNGDALINLSSGDYEEDYVVTERYSRARYYYSSRWGSYWGRWTNWTYVHGSRSDSTDRYFLDNLGDINITRSQVLAKVEGSGTNSATVNLDAAGSIIINASTPVLPPALPTCVMALIDGNGTATIDMDATSGNIDIIDSLVKAETGSMGYEESYSSATVDLDAYYSINISESKEGSEVIEEPTCVIASVNGNGYATVDLNSSYGSISINNDLVLAQVTGSGQSTVNFSAGNGYIYITDSRVIADVYGVYYEGEDTYSYDYATVNLNACSGIYISETEAGEGNLCVIASVDGNGQATINMSVSYGNININNDLILADVDGSGSATVTMGAGGNININGNAVGTLLDITPTCVIASVNGDGTALINMNAYWISVIDDLVLAEVVGTGHAGINMGAFGITIQGTQGAEIPTAQIRAVTGYGYDSSEVNLNSCVGGITITDALVEAIVNNWGSAEVNMDACGDVNITRSAINAIVGNDDYALVDIEAGEDINITDSSILADVNGQGHAQVTLEAGLDIEELVDDVLYHSDYEDGFNFDEYNWDDVSGYINISGASTVRAECEGGLESGQDEVTATALVLLSAGDDINISSDSTVSAQDDDLALVVAAAGGAINAQGTISATAIDGFAGVALLADGDIFAGNVSASGSVDLDLISELEYLFSGEDIFINIGNQYDYSSGILIGSLDGDIWLGKISADMVIAAALFGDIHDANEYSVTGDVFAHYLALIAAGDIGNADFPINTFVDILSAYSWFEGNIYINEADSIELGLYLPIFQNFDLIAEIGFSVAANNGIIHITSGSDMVVNSVIAPQGGVFLQSTTGSIYAGHGWCPLVTDEDLYDLPYGKLIAQGLMDLSDTQWMNAFEQVPTDELQDITSGYYFSPIMFGMPSLTAGPNVIAGGLSFISAPKGMIGVGTPADVKVYNPLKVNIQAFNDVNSALPASVITTTIPQAALTIEMGGSSASLGYTYNTFDGNGPRGISGMIEGIVRPGTMAVTDVFPAPSIFGAPLGYVFYNDTDKNSCIGPLDGSIAKNIGMLQIWPKPRLRRLFSDLFLYDSTSFALPYLEQFARFLFNLMDTRLVNFYHPLVESGMSGFEGFILEEGAYQFIDGLLNINGHDGLLALLDNIKKKKGKK